MHTPFKEHVLHSLQFFVLADLISIDFYSQTLWGSSFLYQIQEVGFLMWGMIPSLFEGEFLIFESLLVVSHHTWGGPVSLHFLPILVHLLFFCCGGTAHLALRSSSEENYSICSFIFVVSIGGGKFRVFLCLHHEPECHCLKS